MLRMLSFLNFIQRVVRIVQILCSFLSLNQWFIQIFFIILNWPRCFLKKFKAFSPLIFRNSVFSPEYEIFCTRKPTRSIFNIISNLNYVQVVFWKYFLHIQKLLQIWINIAFVNLAYKVNLFKEFVVNYLSSCIAFIRNQETSCPVLTDFDKNTQ